MSGFQNVVNRFPSPGVEGDFTSENPRQAMVVGDSALVTNPAGVTVGRFAWADANGVVWNTKPYGYSRLGFAAREGQAGAFIVTWMAAASMAITGGQPITLHKRCDVLARFAAGAALGALVYASFADGSAIALAPGVAAPTANITGTVANGSNQITALSGPVYPGATITGTGIPAGTTITAGAAAGGAATMSANATASGAAEALTVSTAELTGWIAISQADATELADISREG